VNASELSDKCASGLAREVNGKCSCEVFIGMFVWTILAVMR
jgi:hypothetical protein